MPKSSMASPSDNTADLPPEPGSRGAGPDPELTRAIESETRDFLTGVEEQLQRWFRDQSECAASIDAATVPLVDSIAALCSGGKRIRAQLLYWTWRAAGGQAHSRVPIVAAAALEMFQSAALIHDDVIDRSDTRRGMPSAHKRFAEMHAGREWDQDPQHFGVAAAILTGDLALTWSEQLFSEAAAAAGSPEGATADFAQMRTEVMLGQYLDIHAEVAAEEFPVSQAQQRALTVLRYKSAKYSAEHPAALGALLAAAPSSFVTACREFALPLGEAYQIRDDILGVFGDPESTGKPAGDDLREGKRTVIIAAHAQTATPEQAQAVAAVLGDPNAQDAAISSARQALQASGALDCAERSLAAFGAQGREGLDRMRLSEPARTGLENLAQALVQRDR